MRVKAGRTAHRSPSSSENSQIITSTEYSAYVHTIRICTVPRGSLPCQVSSPLLVSVSEAPRRQARLTRAGDSTHARRAMTCYPFIVLLLLVNSITLRLLTPGLIDYLGA